MANQSASLLALMLVTTHITAVTVNLSGKRLFDKTLPNDENKLRSLTQGKYHLCQRTEKHRDCNRFSF